MCATLDDGTVVKPHLHAMGPSTASGVVVITERRRTSLSEFLSKPGAKLSFALRLSTVRLGSSHQLVRARASLGGMLAAWRRQWTLWTCRGSLRQYRGSRQLVDVDMAWTEAESDENMTTDPKRLSSLRTAQGEMSRNIVTQTVILWAVDPQMTTYGRRHKGGYILGACSSNRVQSQVAKQCADFRLGNSGIHIQARISTTTTGAPGWLAVETRTSKFRYSCTKGTSHA